MGFSAIYYTDLHLLDKDITTRLDRSSETALLKLQAISSMAIQHKVDMVIGGGDFTGDKIDSDEYKGRILSAVLAARVPYFLSIGNHDVSRRLFDNYKQRTINILEAAECAQVLDIQLLDKGILGINAYDEGIMDRLSPEQKAQVRTIFAHHYINSGMDRLMLPMTVLRSHFPNLEQVFTGHDHSEYPVTTSVGIKVYRPGSALRTSTATENVVRIPKALLLMFSSDGALEKVTDLPLPARPAVEIFNLESKVVTKKSEAQFEDFVEHVKSAKTVGLDVGKIIADKLAAMDDGSDSFKDLAEDVRQDHHTLIAS